MIGLNNHIDHQRFPLMFRNLLVGSHALRNARQPSSSFSPSRAINQPLHKQSIFIPMTSYDLTDKGNSSNKYLRYLPPSRSVDNVNFPFKYLLSLPKWWQSLIDHLSPCIHWNVWFVTRSIQYSAGLWRHSCFMTAAGKLSFKQQTQTQAAVLLCKWRVSDLADSLLLTF